MRQRAFTLIELSIVLVIIGLVVAGVLVGRDLIRAAAIRATIAEVEKYNTAVNTFKGSYGFMPGDMNAAEAAKVGLTRTGTGCEEVDPTYCGDNNGLIGNFGVGDNVQSGESHLFWLDLSQKGLIAFAPVTYIWLWVDDTNTGLYVPSSKYGDSFYYYVWYGGVMPTYLSNPNTEGDGNNYLSLARVTSYTRFMFSRAYSSMRVADAYAIDSKIDDGYPQSGTVMAMYGGRTGGGQNSALWAVEANVVAYGAPSNAATPASSTTCYDNGGGSEPQRYSTTTNSGTGANCALSFKLR